MVHIAQATEGSVVILGISPMIIDSLLSSRGDSFKRSSVVKYVADVTILAQVTLWLKTT